MPASDLGTWQAVHPAEGAGWLSDLTVPWWIAGGWALDLFLGVQSRAHEDLDIGVLRRDVLKVLAALPSWEIFEAKAGVLTLLRGGEAPRTGVNSLWCRPQGAPSWMLELMLDDSAGDQWVYRRQRDIRRPLMTSIKRTQHAIPYLAPEIQLLFKARNPRARDQADFDQVAHRLDPQARVWLRDALRRTDPGHEWLQILGARFNGGRRDGN